MVGWQVEIRLGLGQKHVLVCVRVYIYIYITLGTRIMRREVSQTDRKKSAIAIVKRYSFVVR